MSTIEEDTVLGRIIYTNNAVSKMNKWGLHTHQIRDTLKHGFLVKPIINDDKLYQKHYRWNGEKEIDCLFRLTGNDGKPLGAIMVLSCWAKNLL